MSEHQIVAFRAIDEPVSDKDLDYMRAQSSRAEVTAWSFDNEYHFGDFRGNALEMLRRGYDLYLHYANFGIRRLMIRLPHGFPDIAAAELYLVADRLRFIKDKEGLGGTLAIEPGHEPGALDQIWDVASLVDRLRPLRGEILDGDLRPLYLAHLAASFDDYQDRETTTEAPVPAGLAQLTDAQQALAEYYCLYDSLLSVAALESPPLPSMTDVKSSRSKWLQKLPVAKKNAWLFELMADPNSNVRAAILAEFRGHGNRPTWPTVRKDRTLAQLELAADEVARQAEEKAKAEAARKRVLKLKQMAADPDKYLNQAKQLAGERAMSSYREMAEILADLREALAGSAKSGLPEQQARKLKAAHPKLSRLISELRQKGFLAK
jgi:hypothetical protein